MQHQIENHRRLIPKMRKKVEKQMMEQMAQHAAFVTAVADEIKEIIPIDADVLSREWLDRWASGEPGICLEVESALLNKAAYTDPREIRSIRSLIQQHTENAPVASGPTLAMEQLESETFELKLKQVEYDLQAIRVAKAKRSTWKTQVYHKKLEYKMETWNQSENAAKHYLKNYVHLVCFKGADDLMKDIHAHKTEVLARLKADERALVLRSVGFSCAQWVSVVNLFLMKLICCFVLQASVCFLNWTAPSTLKNQTMATQTTAASAILGSSQHAVGALLEPVFTYQKNSLWMLQNSCLKRLASAGCTVDKGFVLQFKEKVWTETIYLRS